MTNATWTTMTHPADSLTEALKSAASLKREQLRKAVESFSDDSETILAELKEIETALGIW